MLLSDIVLRHLLAVPRDKRLITGARYTMLLLQVSRRTSTTSHKNSSDEIWLAA